MLPGEALDNTHPLQSACQEFQDATAPSGKKRSIHLLNGVRQQVVSILVRWIIYCIANTKTAIHTHSSTLGNLEKPVDQTPHVFGKQKETGPPKGNSHNLIESIYTLVLFKANTKISSPRSLNLLIIQNESMI